MARKENVVKKLKNGDLALQKAGNDEQLCGFALMVYHGALEELFRLVPKVTEFENNELNGKRAGWLDLTNIWYEYYDLSDVERRYILKVNSYRQNISHGTNVAVKRSIVVEYERFVKQFIQENSDIRVTSISTRQTAVPTDPPRSTPKPTSKKSPSCIKRLVISILIIGLLFFGFRWLSTDIDINQAIVDFAIKLDQFLGESQDFFREGDEGIEPTDDSTVTEEESESPTQSSPDTTTIKIRVQGNSNVRAGPGVDFDDIGIALDQSEYEVLETTPDKNWHKIKFGSDQEGWIGSSRVIQISP